LIRDPLPGGEGAGDQAQAGQATQHAGSSLIHNIRRRREDRTQISRQTPMTGVQKQLIAPLAAAAAAAAVGWQGASAGDATPICRAGEALFQLERAAVGALNNAAPAQVAIGILKALSAHLRKGYGYLIAQKIMYVILTRTHENFVDLRFQFSQYIVFLLGLSQEIDKTLSKN
jgi:hypothetical protein